MKVIKFSNLIKSSLALIIPTIIYFVLGSGVYAKPLVPDLKCTNMNIVFNVEPTGSINIKKTCSFRLNNAIKKYPLKFTLYHPNRLDISDLKVIDPVTGKSLKTETKNNNIWCTYLNPNGNTANIQINYTCVGCIKVFKDVAELAWRIESMPSNSTYPLLIKIIPAAKIQLDTMLVFMHSIPRNKYTILAGKTDIKIKVKYVRPKRGQDIRFVMLSRPFLKHFKPTEKGLANILEQEHNLITAKGEIVRGLKIISYSTLLFFGLSLTYLSIAFSISITWRFAYIIRACVLPICSMNIVLGGLSVYLGYYPGFVLIITGILGFIIWILKVRSLEFGVERKTGE